MGKKVKKEEHNLHKTITIEEAEADGKITVDEFNHLDKRTGAYKSLLEKYKKRNKMVEIIIACLIVLVVFFLAANRTYLRTSFSMDLNNTKLELEIPRFTFYVGHDDNEIVFKTLRKSENTRTYYDNLLAVGVEAGKFDIYYCGTSDTPYYYNSQDKYFITSIDVEKKFVVKTVTVNYTTASYDEFCEVVEKNK